MLVSWALPKGVPTDPRQNHLAVQTEDHPLEYGTFEGTHPEGRVRRGQGRRSGIAARYELEKWRDGQEVIVTLHGEKHGSHRLALIQTGSEGDNADLADPPDEGPEPGVWSSTAPQAYQRPPDDVHRPRPADAGRPSSGRARRAPDSVHPMLATAGRHRRVRRRRARTGRTR